MIELRKVAALKKAKKATSAIPFRFFETQDKQRSRYCSWTRKWESALKSREAKRQNRRLTLVADLLPSFANDATASATHFNTFQRVPEFTKEEILLTGERFLKHLIFWQREQKNWDRGWSLYTLPRSRGWQAGERPRRTRVGLGEPPSPPDLHSTQLGFELLSFPASLSLPLRSLSLSSKPGALSCDEGGGGGRRSEGQTLSFPSYVS